jgi:hypothetical protein
MLMLLLDIMDFSSRVLVGDLGAGHQSGTSEQCDWSCFSDEELFHSVVSEAFGSVFDPTAVVKAEGRRPRSCCSVATHTFAILHEFAIFSRFMPGTIHG